MLKKTLLATAIAASLALPAFAAAPPPVTAAAQTESKHDEKREVMRAQVQEKVKGYMLTTLTQKLGLDATKASKLSASLDAQQAKKRARSQTVKTEMRKLNDLVQAKAPDAQLKAQLDVVQGAASRDDDTQAFLADTSRYLSPSEQAKLAIAMPSMHKDIKKMMHEARREMRGKKAPQGGFGGASNEN
jgi:hypothetical protein